MRSTLVAETVRALGRRRMHALRKSLENASSHGARIRVALDVIFDQYSSPQFAAAIELSLAARGDSQLRAVVDAEEAAIAEELNEVAEEIFGKGGDRRWATVLSTIRGVAMLKLLGHSAAAVDAQWRRTRRGLLAMLND